MKNNPILTMIVGFAAAIFLNTACSPKATQTAETGEASYHGAKITADDAIPVAKVSELVATTGIANTKVKGEITAVCQKKGCWMTMPLADGSDMRVRFKDYGFFVPIDASGRTAIIEGKAFNDTTSVADLRHYAEDAGKTAEEIAKITEPEIAINFEATGVIIEGE